jgi:hypothetical protein
VLDLKRSLRVLKDQVFYIEKESNLDKMMAVRTPALLSRLAQPLCKASVPAARALQTSARLAEEVSYVFGSVAGLVIDKGS